MLNKPWIDPRDVDWTDALNGLRNPGWRQNNNPFVWAALKDPMFQAIRNAKGIEPRIYVCPDTVNQSIPPGNTYDYEVPSEPNTWLFGLNASGEAGQDFLVQVTDSVTGSTLFSAPVVQSVLNAKVKGTANKGPLYFVETPHLYLPPAYPVVRLVNTSASAQICRVTLFCVVEYALS